MPSSPRGSSGEIVLTMGVRARTPLHTASAVEDMMATRETTAATMPPAQRQIEGITEAERAAVLRL